MKNDIVIYTAISKGYDKLADPLFLSPGCDYVCFSDDSKMYSTVWKIVPFSKSSLDSVRKCRQVKILPHRYLGEYTYSVWVDGNIQINGDVSELIEKKFKESNSELFTFRHPFRDCIYEEAKECVRQKRDTKEIIEKQMEKYRGKSYPVHHGLIESNVILRKHNSEKVKTVMEKWWLEVELFSRRDQLSFNYVVWETAFEYAELEGSSRNQNNYFCLRKHKLHFLKIVKYIINRISRWKR